MSRLSTEFDRLYLSEGALIDTAGRTRAAVLELATPADWAALGAVWRAVQTELGWPAPAIAVSGRDGLQLWFSLAQPLPVAEAHRLLHTLQQQHLAAQRPAQVRLWPCLDGATWRHTAPVPAALGPEGPWSAFVSPDLAPLFADSPSLDLPPSDEAQAPLLAGLASTAWAALAPLLAAPAPEPAHEVPLAVPAQAARPGPYPSEPGRFLLAVMNDATVPLAVRVDAAKALLAHGRG